MTDEVVKMLRKAGKCVRQARGKDKGEYTTVCQGCGKKISSSDPDSGDIEFVATKRGDVYFFHRQCFKKAFAGGIKWEKS